MEPPPELKRGPRLVREAFNALRLWAISQRPLPSLDCDVHDSPQGRVILPKPSGGKARGGSASRVLLPWEPYRSTFTGQGDPPPDQGRRFRLSPAHIGGVFPVNFQNELIAPDNMSGVDIPPAWLYWLDLDIQWNGTTQSNLQVSQVRIQSGATVPNITVEDDSLPSKFYIALGTVTTEDNEITKFYPFFLNSISIVSYTRRIDACKVSRGITWATLTTEFYL